jgi:coproporphyrinogen III oxidase
MKYPQYSNRQPFQQQQQQQNHQKFQTLRIQVRKPGYCAFGEICPWYFLLKRRNSRESTGGIRTRGQTDGHWPTVCVSSLLLLPSHTESLSSSHNNTISNFIF